MIELEKNRWNNNLKQYMKEDFYTKAEIDAKIRELEELINGVINDG